MQLQILCFSQKTYNMNDGDRSIEFVYFTFGHNGGVAGIASGGICSPWSQKGVSCLNEYTESDLQTGYVSCLNKLVVVLSPIKNFYCLLMFEFAPIKGLDYLLTSTGQKDCGVMDKIGSRKYHFFIIGRYFMNWVYWKNKEQ